jgi:tetratricopeptide (TPR) repeat protein
MHRVVTSGCLLVLLAAGLIEPAFTDIIHLKDGDVIYADQASESGNHIEYQQGDDTYSIPKSVVVKIEKAPAPAVLGSRGTELPIPAPTPAAPIAGEELVLGRVVANGQVNRDALRDIELRGDTRTTAVAYYIAAKQEFQSGDYNSARRDFESALRNDFQNPAILNFYAAFLIKTGDPQTALLYAEHAVQRAPDSPDAYAVLGYAQFATDHARAAIESWQRSIALRPDASIQQLIARAQREGAVENRYSERETGHFILRYEGAQSSEGLRDQILATLESAYQDLTREFGSKPPATIEVVLYTKQAYFDVTRAPGWTGALNDGKIRIPLRGLSSVTPDLARILRHELTHSFVNQATQGRCPQWLNEGIAQMLEPKSLGSRGAGLAQLFKAEREIPLNALETGFSSLSTSQAELAYAESLATVTYIRDQYGMSDVLRILTRLNQGEAIESALRSTIHCDYRELQEETGTALTRQFGG